jgi:hypothetical protein
MPRRNNTFAAPRCNFTMLARLHSGGGSPRRIASTCSAQCLASSTGNQDPKPAINAFLTWKEGEYELVQIGAKGFSRRDNFFVFGSPPTKSCLCGVPGHEDTVDAGSAPHPLRFFRFELAPAKV